MRASEFMTTDVVTVHPLMTIKKAAGTLAALGIASAPVVRDDGGLVGSSASWTCWSTMCRPTR